MAAAAYEVLHASQPAPAAGHPGHLRDRELEELLHRCARHVSTPATGTVCEPALPSLAGPAGCLLVEHEGVRVWVPRTALDGPAEPVPGSRVGFRHAAARPALSPGFFVTDSSRGKDWSSPVLRVYVHLRGPADTPAVWRTVLERLEAAGARYRAKVLSAPALYPRRDALVVYLPRPYWTVLPDLVGPLDGLPGIGADTSLFAERIAPGVALAFEPTDPDPRRRGLSFGQHRASVLMEALFAAAEAGTDPRAAVRAAFGAARIDPDRPFRNTDSPALPDHA